MTNDFLPNVTYDLHNLAEGHFLAVFKKDFNFFGFDGGHQKVAIIFNKVTCRANVENGPVCNETAWVGTVYCCHLE